jgi:hypothetical protein
MKYKILFSKLLFSTEFVFCIKRFMKCDCATYFWEIELLQKGLVSQKKKRYLIGPQNPAPNFLKEV